MRVNPRRPTDAFRDCVSFTRRLNLQVVMLVVPFVAALFAWQLCRDLGATEPRETEAAPDEAGGEAADDADEESARLGGM